MLVLIMDRERPVQRTEINVGWRFGIKSSLTLELADFHTFERDDRVTTIILVRLGLFPPEGELD